MAKAKRKTVHRNSINGRFVNKAKVKSSPRTTETERVRVGKRGK